MKLCMNLNTIWAQRFQTISIQAKVGDLLVRMLDTLQPRTICYGHSLLQVRNQIQMLNKKNVQQINIYSANNLISIVNQMNIKNKIKQNKLHNLATKQKKQANSQFIRSKLEEQYNPKLNLNKGSLYKFKKDQQKIQSSLRLKQQQNIICSRALNCFKKGEKIRINWDTKSNFRKYSKTQIPMLPFLQISKSTQLNQRCKTQENDHYQTKNNFSNKVYNSLQKLDQKSKKNRSEIKKRLFQLHKSLKNNAQSVSSRRLNQTKSPRNSNIKGIIEQNQQKDDYSQNQDCKIQIEVKNASKQYENISQQNALKQKNDESNEDQFDFSKLRSFTGNQISIVKQSSLSEFIHNRSLSHNSMQFSRKLKQVEQNKSKQYSIINNEVQEDDIFQNSSILNLISKSRQKIIYFKQKIEFQSLTKLQKLKLIQKRKLFKLKPIQQKSNISNVQHSSDNLLNQNIRCLNVQSQNNIINISKQECLQQSKQECLQQSKQECLLQSKHGCLFQSRPEQLQSKRGLLQSKRGILQSKREQFFQQKGFNLKQSQNINKNKQDELKMMIKFQKGKSINRIQQKIIQNTKLKLLKEDLIQKFHQIRILNNSN